MGEFFTVLLHAATNAHILHLKSRSYPEHVALGDFYEKLPGLVDTLVENIQGLTEELIDFSVVYYAPSDMGLDEIRELRDYIKMHRNELPPDSEIQNALDGILSLINSTVYKLKFLK